MPRTGQNEIITIKQSEIMITWTWNQKIYNSVQQNCTWVDGLFVVPVISGLMLMHYVVYRIQMYLMNFDNSLFETLFHLIIGISCKRLFSWLHYTVFAHVTIEYNIFIALNVFLLFIFLHFPEWITILLFKLQLSFFAFFWFNRSIQNIWL